MLAASLGRDRGHGAFQQLEQALFTPSPDTSRVMEGLALLREILSISSMYTMPRSVSSTS